MQNRQFRVLCLEKNLEIITEFKSQLPKYEWTFVTKIEEMGPSNFDFVMVGIYQYADIEKLTELKRLEELQTCIFVAYTPLKDEFAELMIYKTGVLDVLHYPIIYSVFQAKLESLSKMNKTEAKINFENIEVNPGAFSIKIDGGSNLYLPKKEFEILMLLINNEKKVLDRNEIFEKVWKDEAEVGIRTVDVHILRLRRKIGEKHIVTIKGVGYRFQR